MSLSKKVLTVVGAIGVLMGSAVVISPQGQLLLANVINATTSAKSDVVLTDSGTGGPDLRMIPAEVHNVSISATIGKPVFRDADDFAAHRSDNPKEVLPNLGFSYMVTIHPESNVPVHISGAFPVDSPLSWSQAVPNDTGSVDVTCWWDNEPESHASDNSMNSAIHYFAMPESYNRDGLSQDVLNEMVHSRSYIDGTHCHYSPVTGAFYYSQIDDNDGYAGSYIASGTSSWDQFVSSRQYLHILIRGMRAPGGFVPAGNPAPSGTNPFCALFTASTDTSSASDEACVQLPGFETPVVNPTVAPSSKDVTPDVNTQPMLDYKEFVPFIAPLNFK